jgi:hypothetical protein
MTTKLTILVDEEVIDDAKVYAKKQGRSISKIVEEYLKSITAPKKEDEKKLAPIIKSLWGSVKINDSDKYSELLKDALIEKHLKSK